MTALAEHSPLGASGASRWMLCAGSVYQSDGVIDEESDFALEGTAAHALSEVCLLDGAEPWEYIGFYHQRGHSPAFIGLTAEQAEDKKFPRVSKNMADAVDYYINQVERWHPYYWDISSSIQQFYVEKKFHCPDIHELFYGTSDLVVVNHFVKQIHVWDYKHGAGIVVEAERNPQAMYYVAGVLEELDLWKSGYAIVVHIVQPRGWHADGPHRVWETTIEEIDDWVAVNLVPAMDKAMASRDTTWGSHCRFCPARGHQCPSIMEAMAEYEELLMKAEKHGADSMTPEQLGRLLDLQEIAKIVVKAAGQKAFQLLNAGKEVPGYKLVPARTNRVFKRGAEAAAVKEFGSKCKTKPELLTPAAFDALPGGKKFTARWAFKPEGKLTVAPVSDPRSRINRNAKSLFTKQKGK